VYSKSIGASEPAIPRLTPFKKSLLVMPSLL